MSVPRFLCGSFGSRFSHIFQYFVPTTLTDKLPSWLYFHYFKGPNLADQANNFGAVEQYFLSLTPTGGGRWRPPRVRFWSRFLTLKRKSFLTTVSQCLFSSSWSALYEQCHKKTFVVIWLYIHKTYTDMERSVSPGCSLISCILFAQHCQNMRWHSTCSCSHRWW